MLKIGEQTINEIGTAITAVLLDHMPELDKAYQTCEKALSVGVSIKIEPCKEGNRCDIGLSLLSPASRTTRYVWLTSCMSRCLKRRSDGNDVG